MGYIILGTIIMLPIGVLLIVFNKQIAMFYINLELSMFFLRGPLIAIYIHMHGEKITQKKLANDEHWIVNLYRVNGIVSGLCIMLIAVLAPFLVTK